MKLTEKDYKFVLDSIVMAEQNQNIRQTKIVDITKEKEGSYLVTTKQMKDYTFYNIKVYSKTLIINKVDKNERLVYSIMAKSDKNNNQYLLFSETNLKSGTNNYGYYMCRIEPTNKNVFENGFPRIIEEKSLPKIRINKLTKNNQI